MYIEISLTLSKTFDNIIYSNYTFKCSNHSPNLQSSRERYQVLTSSSCLSTGAQMTTLEVRFTIVKERFNLQHTFTMVYRPQVYYLWA